MTRNELDKLQLIADKIDKIRSSVMYPPIKVITGMPIEQRTDHDKIGAAISRVDELEKQYDRIVCNLEPLECDLVYMKYVRGMSYKKISENLGFSERHTKRLLEKATNKLMKI